MNKQLILKDKGIHDIACPLLNPLSVSFHLYIPDSHVLLNTHSMSFCEHCITQFCSEFLQNPFKLYTSVEQWIFTIVCMLYLAYGIVSLTEAGMLAFRAKLVPLVLAPPLLHPLLSYFASPQHYLTSWGLQSYRNFYDY